MSTASVDQRRIFIRELQDIEVALMGHSVEEPTWLSQDDEAAVRWALALARISAVPVIGPHRVATDVIELGRTGDPFRKKLYDSLSPCIVDGGINRSAVQRQVQQIRNLTRSHRDELLRLFGSRLSQDNLDSATRRRPLAIAASGGGGTAYVFAGAMFALEAAGLPPDIIAATSMGAILSAFRCRTDVFELKNLKSFMSRLSWKRVFKMFETDSRFGLPATMKLHLREVIGSEFLREGQFMRLGDMAIPFRVCVAGIQRTGAEVEVDRYAHLLDDAATDSSFLRRKGGAITRALTEVARLPVKPIYLGGDDLTAEFDVLDAVGFSSAVPGVIHYDILRDDPRMVALCTALLEREGCSRLIDGGVADNLPSVEAWRAVQTGAVSAGRDPFVLALDSFAPRIGRHFLFLPLMKIAAETAKRGRRMAHVTVAFRDVLSPMTVTPTPAEFLRAVENGESEMNEVIPLVRKMVGPIPDPVGIVAERDGL